MEEDENNPWRTVLTATIGQPCELICRDRYGLYILGTLSEDNFCFLHDDGHWYNCSPKSAIRVVSEVAAWRYKMVRTDGETEEV